MPEAKLCGDVWLPADEQDEIMLRSGKRYQNGKFAAALEFCKKRRLALDIGAHCGLWTAQLTEKFEKVEAFEPLDFHREIWKKNIGDNGSCRLHGVALGDKPKTVGMSIVNGASGMSHISGKGDIEVRTLDSYGFTDVDFIKIDTEGYEYFVLKGATDTILRCKPVLVVEQKQKNGRRYGIGDLDAVKYLMQLGANVEKEIAGDFIITWGGR